MWRGGTIICQWRKVRININGSSWLAAMASCMWQTAAGGNRRKYLGGMYPSYWRSNERSGGYQWQLGGKSVITGIRQRWRGGVILAFEDNIIGRPGGNNRGWLC
jgi:hypothetical protein